MYRPDTVWKKFQMWAPLLFIPMFQHLEQAQLLGTRGAFIHECTEMGFPAISNAGDKQIKSKPIADKVKTLLFKSFDDVNHQQFFEVN